MASPLSSTSPWLTNSSLLTLADICVPSVCCLTVSNPLLHLFFFKLLFFFLCSVGSRGRAFLYFLTAPLGGGEWIAGSSLGRTLNHGFSLRGGNWITGSLWGEEIGSQVFSGEEIGSQVLSLSEMIGSQVLSQGSRLDCRFSLKGGDWITGSVQGRGLDQRFYPRGEQSVKDDTLPQSWVWFAEWASLEEFTVWSSQTNCVFGSS